MASVHMLNDLPKRHPLYPIIATCATIIMLARCASTTQTFNHTIDEPFHIGAAIGLYDAHKHIVDMTHPPLPWLVVGIPLKAMGVAVPELHGDKVVMDFDQSAEVGRRVLFDQPHNYWTILTVARLTMLLWAALLAFYLYRICAWLASPLVACCAVVLLSTDPTILGHAALINNDVPAGAAFLATLFHGLRWIVKRRWRETVIAGVVVGLAAGTKFTAGLVAPTLILVIAIRVGRTLWLNPLPFGPRWRLAWRRVPTVPQMLLAGLLAFLVLWSLYLLDVGTMDQQNFFNYTPKFKQINPKIRQLTVPMPSLALGLLFQSVHSQNGHVAYLNGDFRGRGWVKYFPETLLVKEPVAWLIGIAIAIVGWLFMKRSRRPWLAALILLPALFYLYIAVTGHVMIGIRHLVPAIALSYGFIAAVIIGIVRDRRIAVGMMAALFVAALVETGVRHPDYLSFFNVVAGGPSHGEKYLLDSNLDWGQDMYRLSEWLKHDPKAVGRSYTMRVHNSLTVPLLNVLGLDPAKQIAKPSGLFAISKNYYYGLPDIQGIGNDLKHNGEDYKTLLKGREPIARIGNSIDVYDLDK